MVNGKKNETFWAINIRGYVHEIPQILWKYLSGKVTRLTQYSTFIQTSNSSSIISGKHLLLLKLLAIFI